MISLLKKSLFQPKKQLQLLWLVCTISTISPPTLPPFDCEPKEKYDGPSADEIAEERRKHLFPSYSHFYKKPLTLLDGDMQYVFDDSGKRYLDAFAGIVTMSCGHCHPEIQKVVNKQQSRLQHLTTKYTHPGLHEYAKALGSKMPGDLKNVFFVNSGTDANKMALKLAYLYTGNVKMIALQNAYHGGSLATLALCGISTWKFPVPVPHCDVHHVTNPDPYRGIFGSDPRGYTNDLQDAITYGSSGRVAGFIAETIQGVGGAVELALGYLKLAYDIVRKAGGVCIADKVQTGFGRTGSHFWGFETQGVIPDIVTMAKGVGNGYPLGAVVTTPKIASVVSQKIHFNTFSGNPVAVAYGHAVLRVLEKENRQQHCLEVGSHLIDRLKTLQERHDIIGDVRGGGLMVGVELVTDRKKKTPATAETAEIFETLRECGALVGIGGMHQNVFRIKPPMCFSKADADFVVDALDYSISKL